MKRANRRQRKENNFRKSTAQRASRERENATADIGLNPSFLQNLKRAKSSIRPTEELEPGAVMMIRPPRGPLSPGLDNRFVSVHRRVHTDDPALRTSRHRKVWRARLHELVKPPADFFKTGIAMWKQMGLHIHPPETAALLRMREIDTPTSNAVQAALMLVYNTASTRDELETALVAIGAFLYADPLRTQSTEDLDLLLPFGRFTGYKLLKPCSLPDNDES